MEDVIKEINLFDPVTELGEAESERHYNGVHAPFARRLFRSAPDVLRYTPHKVLGRRDLRGSFTQRPDVWRLVIMHFSGEDYLDAGIGERVMLDHWNCLQEIRSYRVRETLLHDGLNGQTSCTKHLIAVPRGLDVLDEPASITELTRLFAASFGARRLVHNSVEFLRGTEDRGRRLTDRLLDDAPFSTFIELSFDQAEWAEEFLADPRVEQLLGTGVAAGSVAYELREEPGMDRR